MSQEKVSKIALSTEGVQDKPYGWGLQNRSGSRIRWLEWSADFDYIKTQAEYWADEFDVHVTWYGVFSPQESESTEEEE